MRRSSDLDYEIFNRQETLKLISYKYAIVLGVGGIGSWVAFNLALSGQIKKLFLIDPDVIEESNLNRTPFRFCDIGQAKVDALKYIILERRAVDIVTYQQKTSKDLYSEIMEQIVKKLPDDSARILNDAVIVDCRDDVYEDFNPMPFKYYKIGYDGMVATLDGNPRNTAVWGRANGYRVTPSFVCPAQLAANLVVIDILSDKLTEEDKEDLPEYDTITNTNPFDIRGRLNKVVTFDCKEVIEIIYREMKSREEKK